MSDRDIEDIYPLSPMQQGILFHASYAPGGRAYFEQLVGTLRGDLHVAAFQHAWQQVAARHQALRSSFHWEELAKPLQIVHREAALPWTHRDLRELSAAEQRRALATFLAEDQRQGFAVDQSPLMRFALLRTDDDAHEFVWSHHHLLFDGWSMPALLEEALAFYEATRAGQTLRRPSARPYRDYIAWLAQQDLPRAAAFWRDALADFATPTPLVVDEPRGRAGDAASGPGHADHADHAARPAHAELALAVSGADSAALQAVARRQHVTLNSLVQAAWSLLLARYSGEQDVVFGATVSGRPAALTGVESMVGLFINTLPVRVRIDEEEAVWPWVARLQSQQIEREQYAHMPLPDIQKQSGVRSGVPLFASLLVFENYPFSAGAREQASLRLTNLRGVAETNYPLTLIAAVRETLTLRISYDGERFAAPVIHRMLGHVRSLLVGMTREEPLKIADLPLLTADELAELRIAGNHHPSGSAPETCAHRLFEARADRHPDAVAVEYADLRLTYGELEARANRLARRLQAMGIGPDVPVGVCMERSPELLVAVFAILKAGGAYVPLDPAYPAERLGYMLQDAAVPVLLTQQHLRGLLADRHAARVLCVDSQWPEIAAERPDRPTSAVQAGDLAYIIYTSGSTGRPKGVLLAHRGLCCLVQAQAAHIGAGDRLLQLLSLGFDASVHDIMTALCSGATLVLAGREALLPGEPLTRTLGDLAISHLLITPSLLATLDPAAVPGLHTLWIGAEVCRAELVREWATGRRLFNAYGPTEATVMATRMDCTHRHSPQDPPIGRPLPHVAVHVLDHRLRPVPLGVVGELCLGGAQLARGYLNLPEVTRDRFVRDPADGSSRSILYRTGDRVRFAPTAPYDLEFLGRIDDQIKLRGFRIELGEVEAVLAEHPDVDEVVVVAREDSPGALRLIAYVVSREDAPAPAPAQLRLFARERLPGHMIPAAFVPLTRLPLSPSGKLDRLALPAPGDSHTAVATDEVPPTTASERALAAAWCEVLGLTQVGVHTDFFAAGGHSLLAMQVVARVQESLGVTLPLRQLFATPTIAALAECVDVLQLELAGDDALTQLLDELEGAA